MFDHIPTRDEVLASTRKKVPDLLAPGLRLWFVGINPGLYSAATRHHFARPGNRFWPTLHRAGFTPRQLHPSEEAELLPLGYGITNIARRATATADELTADELVTGAKRLTRAVQRMRPAWLAFRRPKAGIGLQQGNIGGANVWVLPNPSGLNAHYQIDGLVRVYSELRQAMASPISDDCGVAAESTPKRVPK